jgi:hypothetical protein
MSSFGAQANIRSHQLTSAFGGRADIIQTTANVCFCTKADIKLEKGKTAYAITKASSVIGVD